MGLLWVPAILWLGHRLMIFHNFQSTWTKTDGICHVVLTTRWHPMPYWVLTLVLHLGVPPFLCSLRGLVSLVTLHLPSLRWNFLHTHILILALVFLFGDQNLDMWILGEEVIFLHIFHDLQHQSLQMFFWWRIIFLNLVGLLARVFLLVMFILFLLTP